VELALPGAGLAFVSVVCHCGRPLLTVPEAARRLNIGERTLWALTDAGLIPAVRFGRAVRYDPATLDAYVRRQQYDADAIRRRWAETGRITPDEFSYLWSVTPQRDDLCR